MEDDIYLKDVTNLIRLFSFENSSAFCKYLMQFDFCCLLKICYKKYPIELDNSAPFFSPLTVAKGMPFGKSRMTPSAHLFPSFIVVVVRVLDVHTSWPLRSVYRFVVREFINILFEQADICL